MVTWVCLSPQEILGTLDLHVNIPCASQLSKKTAFCLPGGMDYECLHNHQEMHQSLEMGKLHLTLASLKLLARAAVTKVQNKNLCLRNLFGLSKCQSERGVGD